MNRRQFVQSLSAAGAFFQLKRPQGILTPTPATPVLVPVPDVPEYLPAHECVDRPNLVCPACEMDGYKNGIKKC